MKSYNDDEGLRATSPSWRDRNVAFVILSFVMVAIMIFSIWYTYGTDFYIVVQNFFYGLIIGVDISLMYLVIVHSKRL